VTTFVQNGCYRLPIKTGSNIKFRDLVTCKVNVSQCARLTKGQVTAITGSGTKLRWS